MNKHLVETRQNPSAGSDGFPTGYFADQERVAGETCQKKWGGIPMGPQGSLYIYILYLYIPYIYINNKNIMKASSGATENPSKSFPTSFDRFPEDRHQISEITRQSFRRVSDVAVAA